MLRRSLDIECGLKKSQLTATEMNYLTKSAILHWTEVRERMDARDTVIDMTERKRIN